MVCAQAIATAESALQTLGCRAEGCVDSEETVGHHLMVILFCSKLGESKRYEIARTDGIEGDDDCRRHEEMAQCNTEASSPLTSSKKCTSFESTQSAEQGAAKNHALIQSVLTLL
eukprot:1156962-Pelagomonas_calceolata.AAC.9